METPERTENSDDFDTEMGAERNHHVHFEENPQIQNFDQADEPAEFETFFERGRDWQLVKILDSQNHQEGLPEAKLEE